MTASHFPPALTTAEPDAGHRVWAGSRLAQRWLSLAAWLRASLAAPLAHSRLAPQADHLALVMLVALLVASPWVGTGLNAVLVLLATGCVVLRLLHCPRPRARFNTLDLLVLSYVACHLVATAFSPFFLASLKGLAKMMVYWAAYFSFRQVLLNERAAFFLLTALVTTAGLESAYGIYQWVVGVEPLANWEDPEALDPLTRVYGSLMNPNLLAGYLLPVFPLALAAAATSSGRWRWLAIATAAAAPACIFFTYSRGAYLAWLASVGVFAALALHTSWPWLKQRRAWLAGLATGGLAVGGLVVWRILSSQALLDRIASIFTLRGHSSNSFRVNVWHGVVQMVQDNWAFGIGIGNAAFRKMYSLYMVSGYEALGAYNIFLEVLAEMGVLGLLVFLTLLGWVVLQHLRGIARGDRPTRWFSVAMLASMTAIAVMGLFDTVYYRPAVQLQFWLLLALTVYHSERLSLLPSPPSVSGVHPSP